MSENNELLAELPEPPEYLNETAKKEWFRAGKILLDHGGISKADVAVFAAYCSTYADYIYAEKEIAKLQNRTTLTSQGSTLHPMVRYTRECKSQMLVYAKELGLSPRSRKKMLGKKSDSKKKKGSLESFLGGKKIA